MSEPSCFTTSLQAVLLPDGSPLPDAEVLYHPELFTRDEATALFQRLDTGVEWCQEHLNILGRTIPLPRKTAWYGDKDARYSYSGIGVEPKTWFFELLSIRKRAETLCRTEFNSVLLNKYRGASDSVAWHADDEKMLGKNPVIASVSLGQERIFQMRHNSKTSPTGQPLRLSIRLAHGSLLLMAGKTQHHWQHRIPKVTGSNRNQVKTRINLTFRSIRAA